MSQSGPTFSVCLMERNIETHGELRPATINGTDHLIFIEQESAGPYITIPATDLAQVRLRGLFNKRLVVATRTGQEYHFKGKISSIYKIIQFMMRTNPEGIEMAVDVPDTAAVGQTFDLTVAVRNKRTTEQIRVSDIEIYDEYLAGFKIITTDPAAKSTYHNHIPLPAGIDLPDATHFQFEQPVGPGETGSFVFTLAAQEEGSFSGDVSVYGKDMSLSAQIQTLVASG